LTDIHFSVDEAAKVLGHLAEDIAGAVIRKPQLSVTMVMACAQAVFNDQHSSSPPFPHLLSPSFSPLVISRTPGVPSLASAVIPHINPKILARRVTRLPVDAHLL